MSEENIPEEFLCPVSLEIMVDPVICEDGITYERMSIMKLHDSVSPITRQKIDKNNVIPNRALKKLIEQYVNKESKKILEINENEKNALLIRFKENLEIYQKKILEEKNSEEFNMKTIIDTYNAKFSKIDYIPGTEYKYFIDEKVVNVIKAIDKNEINNIIEKLTKDIKWFDKYYFSEHSIIDYFFDEYLPNIDLYIEEKQTVYSSTPIDEIYTSIQYNKSLKNITKSREYYYEHPEELEHVSKYYRTDSVAVKIVGHWMSRVVENVINIGNSLLVDHNLELIMFITTESSRLSFPLIASYKLFCRSEIVEKICDIDFYNIHKKMNLDYLLNFFNIYLELLNSLK